MFDIHVLHNYLRKEIQIIKKNNKLANNMYFTIYETLKTVKIDLGKDINPPKFRT